MPESALKRSFSREDVCRTLEIRESVLDQWEKNGFITRAETYVFRDLVALKTLVKLRRQRIRPERIRIIIASMREKLRHVQDPLSELKIFIDGRRVAVQVDGRKMEPVTGQLLLDFDRDGLRSLLQFPSERADRTMAEAIAARHSEAKRWFERGVELERTGAPAENIITAYSKSLELDPDAPAPHVNLGTVYFHLKKWKEAEQHYRAALALKPDYPLAWFNLGNLFDELNEFDQALESYLTALKQQPDHADAHYNVALLYQGRGDFLKAVHHWRRYLRLDPSGYWAGIARRELNRLRDEAIVSGGKAHGD